MRDRAWFDWFDEPMTEPFVRAIDAQPDTTPIPVPDVSDGRCAVHKRALSYREGKAGLCSWCRPEMFEGDR